MSFFRRGNTSEEEYYNRRLYGHWDPHSTSSVWLENSAYRKLRRELEYYRKHPNNIPPKELLKLLQRIMDAWNGDMRRYEQSMREILAQYDEMIDAMRDREEVYRRLKQELQALRNQIEASERKQRELDQRIREIENDKANNREKAIKYRNQAVQAYNEIVNDPYYQKYAADDLDVLEHLLKSLDKRDLADEAMQALAVQAITKILSLHKIVERKKTEFKTAMLMAEPEVAHIMELFDHWANDTYFDEECQHKADMDFWSFGDFSKLMAAATLLCERIRNGELAQGYFVEQLTDDLEALRQLQENGERIRELVFNTCNVSEQCEQLGLIVAAILFEDFHFVLMNNGYDAGDLRHGYVIEMKSHAIGSKLRFIFSPISETQSMGRYQICFESYQDEELLRDFEAELIDELQYNGIRVKPNFTQGRQTFGEFVDDIEFTPTGRVINLPADLRGSEVHDQRQGETKAV